MDYWQGDKRLSAAMQWLGGAGIFFAVLTLVFLLVGRFWWPTDDSHWAKTLRLGFVIAAILLTPRIIAERERLKTLAFVLFVLFWVGLLLNSIAADSFSSVRQLLLILIFTLVVIAMGGYAHTPWRGILLVAALSGAFFAGVSLINKMLIGQFSFAYREMNLHDSGLPGVADFGITIEAGLNYVFCFVVAIWFLLRSRRPVVILLWSICAFVLLAYVYFTFARSAWVAGLVGSLLLAFCQTSGRTRMRLFLGLLLVALVVGVLGRHELAYEIGSRGLTLRDQVWIAVFQRIGENWWFGHGSHVELGKVTLSTGQVVGNPHSLYLEVFYQFGLVGVVFMLALLGACLQALWQIRSEIAVLWFSVLSAASVMMTVEMHFFVSSPNIVWIWFWLPVAASLAVIGQRRYDKA